MGLRSAAQQKKPTGERLGAESAGNRRPSNLIRVMPAQGVWRNHGRAGRPSVVRPFRAEQPLVAELLAAIVSALLGSAWGTLVLVYGLLQGLAGEVGFAAFRYRRFGWPQALLAAACAGAMAAVLDLVNYYPDWSGTWKVTYLVLVVVSTAVVAGVGGLVLARALGASGALSSFGSGRTRV